MYGAVSVLLLRGANASKLHQICENSKVQKIPGLVRGSSPSVCYSLGSSSSIHSDEGKSLASVAGISISQGIFFRVCSRNYRKCRRKNLPEMDKDFR